MKVLRFSEQQIAFILKQVDDGAGIEDLGRLRVANSGCRELVAPNSTKSIGLRVEWCGDGTRSFLRRRGWGEWGGSRLKTHNQ